MFQTPIFAVIHVSHFLKKLDEDNDPLRDKEESDEEEDEEEDEGDDEPDYEPDLANFNPTRKGSADKLELNGGRCFMIVVVCCVFWPMIHYITHAEYRRLMRQHFALSAGSAAPSRQKLALASFVTDFKVVHLPA